MRKAIVTVSNDTYFLGTQVLFYSVLKHNPSFEGDFVVISYDLSSKNAAELRDQFNAKTVFPNQTITNKIDALIKHLPQYASKYNRFLSLEAFNLEQYDKILFLDSDITCLGKLDELFEKPVLFGAAPDRGFYQNRKRNKDSFKLAENDSPYVFQSTFNSGVMLINRNDLEESTYRELVNKIDAENFNSVASGHSDQFILNQHFENKIAWLNPEWNYLAKDETAIQNKTGKSLNKAVLLHFIRFPKPWQFKKLLKIKLKGQTIPLYFFTWLKLYQEMQQKQVGIRKNYINSIFVKTLLFRANSTNRN